MKILITFILLSLICGMIYSGTAYADGAQENLSRGITALQSKNYKTAFAEFSKAAQQGNAKAQVKLGDMYYNGQGVARDYSQAVTWYRKAAQQGDAEAQTLLGAMYAHGQEVAQDYKAAVKWYRKAAMQGIAVAQYNIGSMYDKGQGVAQNYSLAHMWFNIAAANGSKNGAKARNIVSKNMTPAQIATAQQMAQKWLQKHQKP